MSQITGVSMDNLTGILNYSLTKYKDTDVLNITQKYQTYYFVDGAWMMRLKILKICSEHNAHDGVARLPDVQSSASRNFQPKQRWRRDSEKLLSAEDDRLAPN